MKHNQMGVGLVEVLVALVILAIAILGFVALQVRALSSSQEASLNVQAMTLARDLSERIRMNREGLNDYEAVASPPTQCATEFCTPAQMAQYDFNQVRLKAQRVAMAINIVDCEMGHSSAARRKCIYVAWGDTEPTAESAAASEPSKTACTIGTAYRSGAQCVMMETYNYE
jgi:type IV pilus assembly protein PilV